MSTGRDDLARRRARRCREARWQRVRGHAIPTTIRSTLRPRRRPRSLGGRATQEFGRGRNAALRGQCGRIVEHGVVACRSARAAPHRRLHRSRSAISRASGRRVRRSALSSCSTANSTAKSIASWTGGAVGRDEDRFIEFTARTRHLGRHAGRPSCTGSRPGCFLRRAAAQTCVEVRRVPIPPIVLGCGCFEHAVVLGSLVAGARPKSPRPRGGSRGCSSPRKTTS